ncbi:MAG: hypothetical protein ACE5DM_02985, partial [Candidatus Nanoarchaeia archaeon]
MSTATIMWCRCSLRRVILFGDIWRAETSLHGLMLKFLGEAGIEFGSMVGPSSLGTIPAPKGDMYEVTGMADVDPDLRSARFYGASQDYLMGLDTDHLCKLCQKHRDWHIEIPR